MRHRGSSIACRLIAAALCAAGLAPSASGLELVRRGQSADCTIVVRAEASACERHAAAELRDFLKRQTGVELPVADDASPLPALAVLLGDTRHSAAVLSAAGTEPFDVATLGAEGFRLKVAGDHLLVLGGAGRGPLYGVYELLERFGGCAWYSSRFEVVPELEAFSVPDGLDEIQRPAFARRTQSGNDLRARPQLAARNKLNAASFGPELGGCSFRYDPVLGECHTFERLMPAKRWFADHPEYFAEINGRRVGFCTQLCLSNPDVRRICTEETLRRIAESYPKGIRRYGISQNDWNTCCRCAACRAIDRREKSSAGSLIAFVNHIAEAVERKYPDVVIQTLAYTYTRRPPATLRPRRNVHVCLCTIECDFARPLALGRSIENRQTRRALEVWGNSPATLGVWDYGTDFACYLHPWPDFRSRRANLQLYRACKVKEVLVQNDGAGVNDIWTDLRVWLLAKWMWNPDLEEEPLLARAFRDCFGPAAAAVRQCFDELHGCPRDTRRFPMGCFERVRALGLPNACLDRAAAHLARAAACAEGTPYAENVLRARLPVDFTRALRGYARPSLSRRPVDRARYAQEQEGARRVVSVLDAPGGLRFAGDVAWNAAFRRRICEFAARPPPDKPARRLALEEWNLIGRMPTSFAVADDPLARDGRAVRLDGHKEVCTAWFWMDALDTDAEGLYQPRVRVRSGASAPGGIAFCAGIYNRETETAVSGIVVSNDAVVASGRYSWYSLDAFSPKRGDALWIGLAPGPVRPDVWIDRLEFVRLDPDRSPRERKTDWR